jgi:flagellin
MHQEDAVGSILNNIAALGASHQLAITGGGMQATIQRLTTGKRINMASDDASGLVIANSLTESTKIDNQGQRNANDLLTNLQTTDGTLNEATNLLTRAAELAQEAQAYGAATTPLDAEYQSIRNTFANLIGNAGGSGLSTLGTALGSYGNEAIEVSLSTISMLDGNLQTADDAADATDLIEQVLADIGRRRGNIGAGEESLQAYSNVLGIQMQNKTAQLSQIQDANIADEVVNLTKYQILNQSGTSALGKANAAGQSILSLLQG